MIKLRSYGQVVEITKIEKEPSRVCRISTPKTRSDIIKPRRTDSARRTRRICLRRVLSAIKELGTPLFVTLTFEGLVSDVLLASNALSHFQRRLSIKFPQSASLFVPELSKRGRIHFHGLLFGVSQEWGDFKKSSSSPVFYGRERQDRLFQKLWGYGFVDIRQTDGSPRLGNYISKYVLKASEEVFLTPLRLIRTSKGFPSPVELSMNDDSWLYLLEKMNLKESYSSSFWTPWLGRIDKIYYTKVV